MNICYFDAFSGLSGDMIVGALVDAGADRDALTSGLDALGTGAKFRFEETKRRGIRGTKFHVDFLETKSHRHLSHIQKMIAESGLPQRVKDNTLKVFDALGREEAAVHQLPLEKVHFHEVGAVDSICDIAGACIALDLLGVEEVRCSAVNVGSGTVETAHGTLPVPAPATAALLRNVPIYARGPALELTTPTGAAIATALSAGFGPPPPMTVKAIGYGAGTKDFKDHANVLRAMIGTSKEAREASVVTVLEANIDDSTPEVLGYAMEKLLAAGALDVSYSPLVMKKGRPGVLLRVIAEPERREDLAGLIFRETTTLGLRVFEAERRVQARSFTHVTLEGGDVRVKVSGDGGFSPEFEDCRKVAEASGKPLKTVFAEVHAAYLRRNR